MFPGSTTGTTTITACTTTTTTPMTTTTTIFLGCDSIEINLVLSVNHWVYQMGRKFRAVSFFDGHRLE